METETIVKIEGYNLNQDYIKLSIFMKPNVYANRMHFSMIIRRHVKYLLLNFCVDPQQGYTVNKHTSYVCQDCSLTAQYVVIWRTKRCKSIRLIAAGVKVQSMSW